MAAPIEQKAVAAPSATLVIGYLTGLLIEVVPWLNTHLTPDQKQNLPVILAFVASALAAYFAPHTHRPDLPQPPVMLPLLPEVVVPGQHEAPPKA
jgi:hypothetical protein